MELQSVLTRVRGEFNEMPGLRLTPAQAARLLGLERRVCDRILDELVAVSFLRRSPGGFVQRAA